MHDRSSRDARRRVTAGLAPTTALSLLLSSAAAQSTVEGSVVIRDAATFATVNPDPSLSDLAQAGDQFVLIGAADQGRVRIEDGDSILAGSVSVGGRAGSRLELVGPGDGSTAAQPLLTVTGSNRSPFGYLVVGDFETGASGVLRASQGALLRGSECRATDGVCSVIVGSGYGTSGTMELIGEGTRGEFGSQTLVGAFYNNVPSDATSALAATGRLIVRDGATYETTDLFVGTDFFGPVPTEVRERGTLLADGEVLVSVGILRVADEGNVAAVFGAGNTTRGRLSVDGGVFEVDSSDGAAIVRFGSGGGDARMAVTNGGTATVSGASALFFVEAGEAGNSVDVSGVGSELRIDGDEVGLVTVRSMTQARDGGAGAHMRVSDGGVVSASDTVQVQGTDGGSAALSVTDGGLVLADFVVATGSIPQTGLPDGSAEITVSDGGRIVADDVVIRRQASLTGDGGFIEADVTLDGGTLAPGASPGTLTIDGDLILADGTLAFEIFGEDPSEQDALIITGDIIQTGTVELALDFGEFTPTEGLTFDLFDVADEAALDLSLFVLSVSGLSDDLAASLQRSGGAIALQISAVPLPGAAWLMLGGLAGGVGLRRRGRAAS